MDRLENADATLREFVVGRIDGRTARQRLNAVRVFADCRTLAHPSYGRFDVIDLDTGTEYDVTIDLR